MSVLTTLDRTKKTMILIQVGRMLLKLMMNVYIVSRKNNAATGLLKLKPE